MPMLSNLLVIFLAFSILLVPKVRGTEADCEVILWTTFAEVIPDGTHELRIIRILENTPLWTLEYDNYVKDFILKRYQEIAQYDTKTIRAAIAEYCSNSGEDPFRIDDWGKGARLTLLNRLLFDVPAIITSDNAELENFVFLIRCEYDNNGPQDESYPYFLRGPKPSGSKEYYAIAPLAFSEDGTPRIFVYWNQFVLADRFGCGKSIREFDYFASKYPRRELPGAKPPDHP